MRKRFGLIVPVLISITTILFLSIYNALPDVIFFNSRTSKSAQFGPGNYLGNLQLDKRDIKKIIHQINTTNPVPAFVLFAPILASSNAGQINYTIFLTNDYPTHSLVFLIL
jgi:hypothetical protein